MRATQSGRENELSAYFTSSSIVSCTCHVFPLAFLLKESPGCEPAIALTFYFFILSRSVPSFYLIMRPLAVHTLGHILLFFFPLHSRAECSKPQLSTTSVLGPRC